MNYSDKHDSDNRFLKVSNNVRIDYNTTKNEKAQIADFQSLMEWMKRLYGYATFLYANTLKYRLKRGEVYEVDFGRNVGSELNERHYAVIMNDSTEDSQNVLVCPLTTKYSEGGDHALVNIGRLPGIVTVSDSFAKISQLRTIDKVRIYIRPVINNEYNGQDYRKKVGPVSKLNDDQIELIITALIDVFDNKRRI